MPAPLVTARRLQLIRRCAIVMVLVLGAVVARAARDVTIDRLNKGGPISYAVNGKQYVATPSGWGSGIAGSLAQFFPELEGARQGATIHAFALPDSANPRR